MNLPFDLGGMLGMHFAASIRAMQLISAITAKESRQERLPLRKVANGTPNRLAKVMPEHMSDTAVVLCRSSASCTATSVPTP